MDRMTHERVNGIRAGYWSPEKKEELVQRLAAYENTGLEPEEVSAKIEACNIYKSLGLTPDQIQELKLKEDNDGWIPVEERLPDAYYDCEVTLYDGRREIGWCNDTSGMWFDKNDRIVNVIAWKEPSKPVQAGKESGRMTGQEAIKALKLEGVKITGGPRRIGNFFEALDVALSALEEIQKYWTIGTVEEFKNSTREEDILKFYYCESEDDYYIGKRVGNFYYARYGKTGFTWFMSRYLPWGEHVIAPNTLWKEHIYPSEPKEIPFFEWLQGFIKKYCGGTVEECRETVEAMKKLMGGGDLSGPRTV